LQQSQSFSQVASFLPQQRSPFLSHLPGSKSQATFLNLSPFLHSHCRAPFAFGLAVLTSLRDNIFRTRDPASQQTANTSGPRRLQQPSSPGARGGQYDEGIKRFVVHAVSPYRRSSPSNRDSPAPAVAYFAAIAIVGIVAAPVLLGSWLHYDNAEPRP
jgi:hypothetical protein